MHHTNGLRSLLNARICVSQLNREISHENIVALKEVILEDKSIYMVFEYAEHDFLVGRRRFLFHVPH